jgi:AsmA protein
MAKKIVLIIGGILALLVIVALILPFVFDANRFRPQVESLMSAALNRKVSIGNIQLSIFSGGVAVNDLTIADDPTFSREPFLTAKSVTLGVELQPLIFSKKLNITSLMIEGPHAMLLHNAAGAWNFSSLGAQSASAPKTSAAAVSGGQDPGIAQTLAIQKLTIQNGTVSVGNAGANGRLHNYNQVNLTASNLSYTTQFPFELSADTPAGGTLSLKGTAGPLNQSDMQKTPVNANLEAKKLDLAATGFVEPASGISGVVDFSGTLNSDGRTVNTKGTATANKLQLVPGGAPASQPVQIDYQTNYGLATQEGTLAKGDVHVGKALAQLTGNYQTRGETTSLQMKLKGSNMPATDLSSLLPALGVILPPNAKLQQGTLTLDVSINGPTDRLVTSGPVRLQNAKLANFDLGSKMKALSTFAGIPKASDTVIQNLSSDLRVSTDGIRADNFSLIVPSIGSLSGNGTISPKQELNFKMAAKLGNAASPVGALSSLAGLTGGNSGGIPFRIEGTTSNPVFVPDVAGIAKGLASGASPAAANGGKAGLPTGKDLGQALGGLFGRKKQQ